MRTNSSSFVGEMLFVIKDIEYAFEKFYCDEYLFLKPEEECQIYKVVY